MQFKQFIIGFLCIGFALISQAPMIAIAEASPQMGPAEPLDNHASSVGPCDPSTIGIESIHPPSAQGVIGNTHPASLVPMSKNGLFLRWCFTFQAIQDNQSIGSGGRSTNPGSGSTNLEAGTLEVIEHVEIWRQTRGKLKLFKAEAFTLSCQTAGGVYWDEEEEFISFEEGKITCATVNLHKAALKLSRGKLDTCEMWSNCEIPVTNVVNYVNIVPPTTQTPFLKGPLFFYEEVVLGGDGTVGNQHIITLDINDQPMSVNLPGQMVQDRVALAIEQRRHWFDFAVHGQLLASQAASQPVTLFNSDSETIYFGYNPDTEEYLEGSIFNGIFDPYAGTGLVY